MQRIVYRTISKKASVTITKGNKTEEIQNERKTESDDAYGLL